MNALWRASVQLTPSADVSIVKSFVAALGSSPQVFDGSRPKDATVIVFGSSITDVGGPRCGFSGPRWWG